MRALDPGHLYELRHLDGPGVELLRFVKRDGPGYPGNIGAYEGTTIQETIRVLIDRLKYVREQAVEMSDESSAIADARMIWSLRDVLWDLEARAARRHDRPWPCVGLGAGLVESIPVCAGCGHIGCDRVCGR